MKKRFLIITVAQTIVILVLLLFAFVQKPEADRQRQVAEDYAKEAQQQKMIADQNAMMAQQQRIIAEDLRARLANR
ncbi:MAG TPA: hypothetical protein VFI14_04975 [Chryseosolibacter sp.]|nr:hypothetical protein [Chryseosolibacter sp.]